MKLLGENSNQVVISRKFLGNDLFEINFSCDWCSGQFEFFSSAENIQNLHKLLCAIARGKKIGDWLSDEGDIELIFSVQPLGLVRTSVVCCPSVNLAYSGKLEFELELELSSFDEIQCS